MRNTRAADPWKHFGRLVEAVHLQPPIAGRGAPRRARHEQLRHAGDDAGRRRLIGDVAGERMGRVDDHIDLCASEVLDDARRSAETADPRLTGQRP